ncbi:hypothetical protein M5362_12400 [Streptomyces sp. Je 1-79]|uniref:hypothetical protein n=1 Tax=Streptomyces sp. Je 1-79 TaxID=2943847 RepID=UPI0021A4A52F|nr:hypothetical protein [Streptomyces sp. Je 1-79]MCT4353929.1 hypothetical protein [Streptomyces sp. Je 1-79]
MAQGELTARETAAWDQLAAGLRSATDASRRPPERRTAPSPAAAVFVAVVLFCALALLVAGSVGGLDALSTAGVAVWVAGVLAVSHLLGHGPRLPWRRRG